MRNISLTFLYLLQDYTNILSAVDEQGGLMIIDAHKPAANSVVQGMLLII